MEFIRVLFRSRALDQGRRVQERRLRPSQAPLREGRGAPPGKARRKTHYPDEEAGRLYRRSGRRSVQAGPLSLLIASTGFDPEKGGRLGAPPFSFRGCGGLSLRQRSV